MAYATLARMQTIFGATNIALWSDANNTTNAGEIAARQAWAIAAGDDEVNDRLRESKYAIPFTTVPNSIVDLASMCAGLALYRTPRQMVDDENTASEVSKVEARVEKTFKRILAGQISLDAEAAYSSHPSVVN